MNIKRSLNSKQRSLLERYKGEAIGCAKITPLGNFYLAIKWDGENWWNFERYSLEDSEFGYVYRRMIENNVNFCIITMGVFRYEINY